MKFKKNSDGTDLLDEQGNPVPEDTNTEEESEQKKINKQLVEEIKDMREKMRLLTDLAKDKLDTPPTNPQPPSEDEKITATVKKVLQEAESSKAKANKLAAFEKYVIENKDFHPDNDQLGLKRDALLAKFNLFNTDSLNTVEEFTSVIRDAHRLLGGNDKNPDASREINPYSSTPTPSATPTPKDETELSPTEKKLCEQSGWTKEKFLKTKAKHPRMVEDLLSFVRV